MMERRIVIAQSGAIAVRDHFDVEHVCRSAPITIAGPKGLL
jgi:hypothetical protein